MDLTAGSLSMDKKLLSILVSNPSSKDPIRFLFLGQHFAKGNIFIHCHQSIPAYSLIKHLL